MAIKQELSKSLQTPKPKGFCRFKRFVVLAGALASSIFCGCSSNTDIRYNKVPASQPTVIQQKETVKMRCYDYHNNKLNVYIENVAESRPEKQLGSEKKLNFTELGIAYEKDNVKPLAYFCTHAGYLFWVTADAVYLRRITVSGDAFKVEKILDAKHVEPDEYAVAGVKVVSADVWQNPAEHWEKITVATLTNTGLFQAMRFSEKALINNNPERAIYNLVNDNLLELNERWPEKGVLSGIVRVLDYGRFSIIPLGIKGKGSVRNFYYIELKGKQDEIFRLMKADITTMQPWKRNPQLKNIFEVSKPIRYEKRLGGWVVNLTGEKRNGMILPLFPIVTPFEKDAEKKE